MRSIRDRANDIPVHKIRARSATSKEPWYSPIRKKIVEPPTIINPPTEINEPSIELIDPPNIAPEPITESTAPNVAEMKLINEN